MVKRFFPPQNIDKTSKKIWIFLKEHPASFRIATSSLLKKYSDLSLFGYYGAGSIPNVGPALLLCHSII